MRNWNLLDRNTASLIEEEATSRLSNTTEAMAQLRLGMQRAEQVCVNNGKTFPWLSVAISQIAVKLCLYGGDKLIPMQEAIQFGTYEDELTKKEDRKVFAEAVYACFNITPKRIALWSVFSTQASEEKAAGTFLAGYYSWDDLTNIYTLATKWGASNCTQEPNTPWFHATGYKAYGSKWYNRENQDGSTRPVDVQGIVGRTAFKLQQTDMPAFHKEIDPRGKTSSEILSEQKEIARKKKAVHIAVNQFNDWGEVYFAAFGDYRNRTYLHGTQPHPQGCDWDKGLFEFADERPLNSTGVYWLKVAVANTMGLDKEIYAERISAVDEILAKGEIHTLIKGVVEGNPDSRLEEPFLFRNLAVGLLRGLAGEPVGSICHVDATASGLQLMAAALGDVKGMIGSNVIDHPAEPEERKDPYPAIYNSVGAAASLNLSRSDMKYDCTMPWMYGGSAGVRTHFGDQEHLFYQGAAKCFPSAYRYLGTLKDKWSKTRIHGQFTLPDGVVVHVNRVKDKNTILRTNMGAIHLVDKEIGTDRGQFVAHLSAMIHGLDGWIVRECIRHMDSLGRPIVTVHDSFGVHPNDVPQVQYAYKKAVCRLVQEPLLQDMIKELFFVDFDLVNPLSQEHKDQICEEIMASKYILC